MRLFRHCMNESSRQPWIPRSRCAWFERKQNAWMRTPYFSAACSSALAITKLVYASGRMRNASPTHLNETWTRS
jgi:hypothetical protein